MNTNEEELVTAVVGAVYEVSNTLGCGFLERIYERALARELSMRQIKAATQVAWPVNYKGAKIGSFLADLVVEDRLLLELKCVETFTNEHIAQCLNYLKVSNLRLALLINFQHPKVAWKRLIL